MVAAAPKPTPSPTVVAVLEPAPTATLAAQPVPAHVSVFKVKTTDSSGLEAQGSADPGARLRLKLNGSFVAEVTANPEGHWSLSIDHGLTTGFYSLRAELLDAGGRAGGAAESSFAFAQRTAPIAVAQSEPSPTPPPALTSEPAKPAPVAIATPGPVSAPEPVKPPVAVAVATPAPAPASTPEPAKPVAVAIATPAPVSTPAPAKPVAVAVATPTPAPVSALEPAKPVAVAVATPAPAPAVAAEAAKQAPQAAETPMSVADPSHAVVAEIRAATVVKGDNLWDLARHYYGDGLRYADIYHANENQIRNPNLIFVGQVFVVPQPETKTQ